MMVTTTTTSAAETIKIVLTRNSKQSNKAIKQTNRQTNKSSSDRNKNYDINGRFNDKRMAVIRIKATATGTIQQTNKQTTKLMSIQ